jgi:type IV secretory pathway TrbL component
MNKSLVITGIIVIVLLVVGMVAWNMTDRYPADQSSTETPSSLSLEQAGVEDLAAEADTLDTNFDSDIKQLDTELQGL